jgi:hypothetical protein
MHFYVDLIRTMSRMRIKCVFTLYQDPDERAFSALVAEALEVSVLVHRFPKNTVEIHVLVLEDDGGAALI